MATSLNDRNSKGQTLKSLLEVADTLYQYHTTDTTKKVHRQREDSVPEEDEWSSKIAGELHDEYEASWGRYEDDYFQPVEEEEEEDYDTWASRMIHERRRKLESCRAPPPPPKVETKPSWTAEDQERFLKEEEQRKQMKKVCEKLQQRKKFHSKLGKMVQNENAAIGESDLPFKLSESVTDICELIVADVEDVKNDDAKRKLHRELQRLWHPDKFCQKFSQRISEDIRPAVLKKITEISQCLNVYRPTSE